MASFIWSIEKEIPALKAGGNKSFRESAVKPPRHWYTRSSCCESDILTPQKVHEFNKFRVTVHA